MVRVQRYTRIQDDFIGFSVEEHIESLRKAVAQVGAVHYWKEGGTTVPHQKTKMRPPTWQPVKRGNGGKWVKDSSRPVKVEEGDALQTHEVKPEDGKAKQEESKRGRPKAKEGLVRRTDSQGIIVSVGGKTFKYTGDVQPGENISGDELSKFQERSQKLKDRAEVRSQKKADAKDEKPKEDTPKEKSGRGRKSDTLGTIKIRGKGTEKEQKWAKVSDGQGTKDWVKYNGDKEPGDLLDDSEIEALKATPKGKRGRRALEPGTIVSRKTVIGREYKAIRLGEGRETVYQGDDEVGTVVSNDELREYIDLWQYKQSMTRSRRALTDFIPRERNFVRPGTKKLKRKNPFSPLERKPNRGTVTERGLINKNGTQIYSDSGVQVVKGSNEHLVDTNYLSEDLRASMLSHQRDFINQSMNNFAERKMKSMFNFDGTGAGKTYQQLGLAETFIENQYNEKTIKPVFIVTASDRIINDAFLKDAKALKIRCNVPENADEVQNGVNIITYSSLHKFMDQARKSDLILFDEAHKMKGSDSRSGRLGAQLTREVSHTAMFTATPVDKNEHLVYLANALNMDESKLLTSFGYKYSPPKKTGEQGTWNFNKSFTDQEIQDNIARINELTKSLEREGVLVRREKSMSGLHYIKKKVEVPKEAVEEMEDLFDHARQIETEADPSKKLAYGGKWIGKRRSALENFKIEAAVDTIEEEIKSGRQVVFFATRANDSLVGVPDGDKDKQIIADMTTDGKVISEGVETGEDGIERNVKYYKQISGTIPEIEKELATRGITFTTLASSDEESKNKRRVDSKIQAFQNGEVQVFLTTPQSGGTGLNLDDRTGKSPRTAIIMTPPYSASDLTQMIGRIHRLSTQSQSRAIVLSSGTATDEWNEGITNAKIQSLGGAVEGDVSVNLHPKMVEAVSNMGPEEAAQFLESVKKEGGISLQASEAVKPYEADDFVSPANQMTQRAFGMNDISVLQEYDFFHDIDVDKAQNMESKFSKPDYTPKEELPLPLESEIAWSLPVDKQNKVGKIIASRTLGHAEVPQFYVVVGKDEQNAYAKPIDRNVSKEEALRAMLQQRYKFVGEARLDAFFEEISRDIGPTKIEKARRGPELPEYNGAGVIATPEMNRLTDQLLLSIVGSGSADSLKKLYAGNKFEFLENVY